MAERKTISQFIKDSKKIHGDKYDYSLVDYVNWKTKVKIICPNHGVFEQKAGEHSTQGRGCKYCFKERKFSNTEQFIEKAKKVHGEKYDYSLVEYVHNKSKVKIICPEHGEFSQEPSNHNVGNGCKQCSIIENAISLSLTTEQFIKKAKQVHGDKYDYSLVEYTHSHAKVKIVCPEHGEFSQEPNTHVSQGSGCKDCSYIQRAVWRFSDWYNCAKRSKHFDSFKIYFIKCYDEDEVFYKIGNTYNKIDRRFESRLPYQYEVLNTKEVSDINDREGARMIYDMEKRFKRMNKSNKYFPKKKFGGMFECFSSPDGPLDGPALS
tara:strand:- start:531 stop:1493 length:963 start_codon:yes stop_codon:yes gene_type:complete